MHLFSSVFEQAEKNVYLEERLQVLQQQNEDLKERIDKNVAVSRSDKFKCIFERLSLKPFQPAEGALGRLIYNIKMLEFFNSTANNHHFVI